MRYTEEQLRKAAKFLESLSKEIEERIVTEEQKKNQSYQDSWNTLKADLEREIKNSIMVNEEFDGISFPINQVEQEGFRRGLTYSLSLLTNIERWI